MAQQHLAKALRETRLTAAAEVGAACGGFRSVIPNAAKSQFGNSHTARSDAGETINWVGCTSDI
jgi:hypothetical protein